MGMFPIINGRKTLGIIPVVFEHEIHGNDARTPFSKPFTTQFTTLRLFMTLPTIYHSLGTCRDIKAERKNVALPMPPIKLLVSETNHSPSKIHGTGVIPVPRKNINIGMLTNRV